jgi:hypothetical protein
MPEEICDEAAEDLTALLVTSKKIRQGRLLKRYILMDQCLELFTIFRTSDFEFLGSTL